MLHLGAPTSHGGKWSWRIFAASTLLLAVTATASADPSYIYGLHDPGGESLMGNNKGWIVWTEAIGTSGTGGVNYSSYANAGYGVIVRLNNGYGGSGNLPYESQYDAFATRCANFVDNSSGVSYYIVGNECNLPREWPGNDDGDPETGQPITATRYASCYNKCYTAMKAKDSSAKICPAPVGTWAPPYTAQGIPGFMDYWLDCLDGIADSKIDAVILHTYTHGCDPGMITSEMLMDAPYSDIHYHFRVYQDYMDNIPSGLTSKPVLITECDQNVECADGSTPRKTWYNVNNGWMQAAYAEINNWNLSNDQQIRCLVMFRWPMVTEGEWTFGLADRYEVQDGFEEAVAEGYEWGEGGDPPDPEDPDFDGTNIADNSTQYATSANYSSSYAGDKAIDEVVSGSSKWCSDGSSMPEWLKLDLGGSKTIYGVKVRHAGYADEPSYYNTEALQIQTAASYSGTYTTVATVNNSAQDDFSIIEFVTPITAQFIRLYITDAGTDNYVRIPEFEVWGENAPSSVEMTETAPSGTNCATSASQVATDTYYGANWTGSKAIDGTIEAGSKWCSTGASSTHWIKLDLGSTKTINGYKIHHAEAGGENSYYNTQLFKIQVGSSYTGPWTTHADVDNSDQADEVTNLSYTSAQQVRYVQMYITDPGTDNYARIPEIQVYEEGDPPQGKTTVEEDFGSVPSWTSSYNASWGSAASWSAVSGGQSGNAMKASRTSQGSSAKVKVYTIDASTDYTISVYMKSGGSSNTYWAECAYKLGSNTANNFDDSGATWTMIQKFENGGTNGNGDTWVAYSKNFNSGGNTQISVGYKLGSSGGSAPDVLWDTLRID